VLDLNAIVHGLAGMLRRLIGEDIELATDLGEDLGHVKADPGQIEQVIINLAVNARDAMPDGGHLLIETRNMELDDAYARQHATVSPGVYVMLAVSDTGTGIDEKDMGHIFEPFFTTKEQGKGTGLGLSTAYGIVKQAGGHIAVYSEVGHGTTFKVYLQRTGEVADEAVGRPAQGHWRGHGESILLVEDEAGLRDIVRELLRDLGYRPSVAANGGEALLAVEERGLRPALLITDIVMPEMGGPVLAERLKRTLPSLKVVYMSGYTDSGVVAQRAIEAGTPFLQKPFRIADLAAVLAKSLGPGEHAPPGSGETGRADD
jgi:CheY-like chemotaxis protein